MHAPKRYIFLGFVFLSLFLLLAACQGKTPVPTSQPVNPSPEPSATAQPAATETPVQSKTLVVCTQDEPQTLYIYGGSSRSMWSVLEAVYDGPYDTRSFSTQPVILEKIPSLADGDAVLTPRKLQAGDPVIDTDGNLVALKAGTKVLPSGCSSPECATTWDGSAALEVDQLVVKFKLKAGIQWSDGQSLKASDSVYSYNLASDPATPASKYLTDRTFTYKALDDLTVEWTGMPGFFEQRYGTFFWLPLPEHIDGTKSAQALLSDAAATRSPVGWGPYVVQEWVAGDHITLRKNDHYFRAGEGLPYYDTLVYRFSGDAADGNMNGLLAGECDVVDQNSQFLELYPGLLEREKQNKLKIYVGQGPEWEHLDFGIRPAAYDDGYDAASGDRPDLFGDVRVRQAFAYCIDRQAIIDQFLYNRSDLPDSFLPPSHPLFQKGLTQYTYNPDEGNKLLDEAGWKDSDANPDTPRVAAGVNGVPDGTTLSVTYLTTEAGLRKQVAQAIAGKLKGCGVQAKVQLLTPGSLFSPGPDGQVFGRKFDLVAFSWEASARPNCMLYSSAQIPGAANQWIGANISGFNSPEYDAACEKAYWARPIDSDYSQRNARIQEQYVHDLPSIPLYFYPKIAISRADLCGLEMDVTARSILWNIESIRYGQGCK
jgi:peptide/nickel transport system substrate-binding protein